MGLYKDKVLAGAPTLPMWEFVAMMAALIGMTALAIDIMLPAFDDIARHYERSNPNDQQLIFFSYIIGFGVPQLFYGPITDRFGRKGLLRGCLIGYVVFALICMATQSFMFLLLARFFQGVVSSGIRVVAVSIVRDLTQGRGMAKVMSLIMTVFMAIPIIAPILGEGIIYLFSWQWTFGALGLYGLFCLIWTELRLPETLPLEGREPLNLKSAFRSYKIVCSNRITLGYILAGGIIFSALFGFLAASEQIFTDTFGFEQHFAFLFAGVAATLVFANYANARLVEKLGMRLISHTVLLVFIGLASTSLILMHVFGEKFEIFYPLFALNFACFGMLGANFTALAMEPMGERAGTANAANGFIGTTVSAALGYFVADQYDGTVSPFLTGFVWLGLAALAVILVTERGRLFKAGAR